MASNTYVAIMAGGVGSRFWPASREARPKQFMDITGSGKSLLRMTFERFLNITTAERIFIVTNDQYKDLVKEHLPELIDEQILCEPSRNNTAPCVAYAAFKLQALNPEANLIIGPSDALIRNEGLFVRDVEKALAFTSENEAVVTLGIAPTEPHTGYGYIQYVDTPRREGIYPVKRFTEKPNRKTAEEFVNSGDYLWNAGIFIARTAILLDAFASHAPDIYSILSAGSEIYNTDSEQEFINEHYPKTPKISVDYAIMEKANNIFTVPVQFGWSDLGAWGALYQEGEKDDNGNVTSAAQLLMTDAHNCLIRAPEDKLVVIGGVDDLLIIDEGDVLLVYPRKQEQNIKQLREKAADKYGEPYV